MDIRAVLAVANTLNGEVRTLAAQIRDARSTVLGAFPQEIDGLPSRGALVQDVPSFLSMVVYNEGVHSHGIGRCKPKPCRIRVQSVSSGRDEEKGKPPHSPTITR